MPRHLLAHDLDDGAAGSALAIECQPHEAPGTRAPRLLGELVELVAPEVAEARDRQADDPATFAHHGLEGPESGRRCELAEVPELHAVAHVGLVRPEAVDGLAIGEARERIGQDGPIGSDGPCHRERHPLDPGHHVVLADEAHLEVELCELGLSVAPQVLVTQAARDLEVAVEATDHEELLELLRTLGQGVDAPRLQPGGDDEVPRTLGRGLDEEGRLDLDEACLVVHVADGLHEPSASQDAPLEGLAAQVEVAVLQAQGLVDLSLRLVDLEGRRARFGEDLDAASLAAPQHPSRDGRSRSPPGAARWPRSRGGRTRCAPRWRPRARRATRRRRRRPG